MSKTLNKNQNNQKKQKNQSFPDYSSLPRTWHSLENFGFFGFIVFFFQTVFKGFGTFWFGWISAPWRPLLIVRKPLQPLAGTTEKLPYKGCLSGAECASVTWRVAAGWLASCPVGFFNWLAGWLVWSAG